MKILRRIVNPLMAFIGIQLLWIVVVIFWIRWFMGSHRKLRTLAEKYSPDLLQGGADWFILGEGLVLLVAILAGVYVIFLYWTRQSALYKAQRNFIAQVTHELKSPLASLQLHLETIRRRRLSPEKMETFLDTMLSDTERLDTLVNNMLAANRLERRSLKLTLQPTDLSELVQSYFGPLQYSLPRAGSMQLDITPGLWASVDRDSLEIALRNLMENAVLYSDGAPSIKITLYPDGRYVHLSVSDRGRGMEHGEVKKVFRMFYRVRGKGKNIKGSGLGLFIVLGIVRRHRGKVWLESGGPGQGTTVHIHLPAMTPPSREAS